MPKWYEAITNPGSERWDGLDGNLGAHPSKESQYNSWKADAMARGYKEPMRNPNPQSAPPKEGFFSKGLFGAVGKVGLAGAAVFGGINKGIGSVLGGAGSVMEAGASGMNTIGVGAPISESMSDIIKRGPRFGGNPVYEGSYTSKPGEESALGIVIPPSADGETFTGSASASGVGTGTGSGVTSGIASAGIGAIPGPTKLPASPITTPPLTAGTTGIIPASDFITAGQDPNKMSEFMGKAFQGVTELQSQYNKTRSEQPKGLEDLKASNLDAGYDAARAQYLSTNVRVNDFNAIWNNVENDVRRDYGSEATESFIQAEMKRRMNAMEPQRLRLEGEQASALTAMQAFSFDAQQQYTARRADAEEAVSQVAQKLGFQNANITQSAELFNQVKNFELTVDAQKDKVRDGWRTLAATLVSTPALLYQASNQDLVNIASMAQMPVESLTSLKKVFSQGVVANTQLGDDGSLGYAVVRPDGSWLFGKQANYAHVAPKASGTASLAALQSPVNMSLPYRTAYLGIMNSVKGNDLTPDERASRVFQGTARLEQIAIDTLTAGQRVDPNFRNDADFAMTKALKNKILGQAVTSSDDLAAAFSEVIGGNY